MLGEEGVVGLGLLVVVRRERDREHRHAGGHLRVHQPLHHRVGDKVVAIDAAIDDEGRGDHGVIASGLGQALGQERHLERAGHVIGIDGRAGQDVGGLGQEALVRAVDDVGVPARADEGDTGLCLIGHFGTLR